MAVQRRDISESDKKPKIGVAELRNLCH